MTRGDRIGDGIGAVHTRRGERARRLRHGRQRPQEERGEDDGARNRGGRGRRTGSAATMEHRPPFRMVGESAARRSPGRQRNWPFAAEGPLPPAQRPAKLVTLPSRPRTSRRNQHGCRSRQEGARRSSSRGSNGKTVTLSDYAGKTFVLYFYPKDDTPGCTQAGVRPSASLASSRSRRQWCSASPQTANKTHKKFDASTSCRSRSLADEDDGSPRSSASGSRSRCTARSTWASSARPS